MTDQSIAQRINDLEGLTNIQCSNGNWNYDPYMHGMANGMILSLATMKGEEPKFLSAPDTWLEDLRSDVEPEAIKEELRK